MIICVALSTEDKRKLIFIPENRDGIGLETMSE